MSNLEFHPEQAIGEGLLCLDKQELLEFVSQLCLHLKAQVGSRAYHGGIFPVGSTFGSLQSIIYGVLSCLSSWYNFNHFSDLELANHFLQKRNPRVNACHNDCVHLRMVVEKFQRVDYYRFPVELEKLLWA